MTITAKDIRGRSQRRWWQLNPVGAFAGLAGAALSVTPSLLPRPPLLQGAVAAVAFATGYALGVAVWALLRAVLPARVSAAQWMSSRILWMGYAIVWLAGVAVMSIAALVWQNEIRRLVEMPPLESVSLGAFFLGFAPLVVLLLAAGKGMGCLYFSLRQRVGVVVGLLGVSTVLVAAVAALTVTATIAVDVIYRDRNASADAGVTEPPSTYRSAGTDSAIDWEDLGRHGAAFVAGGPTAAEISALTGTSSIEPIRVYAGIESAPTLTERADLVVSELERTGAFDRAVLVVATTTGSGWLESQTVDAVEYLYAGDTAIASMQYAYTPSWVSFLFDPDAPVDAATILFGAVEKRWLELPIDDRPLLVTYGLSLGAHGSQATFAGLDDLRLRVDGALLVGSPNGSALWRTLQASRDAGSPVWQPVLNDGREVRWMSQEGDQNALPGPWAEPRVLYLQHATDPVTWLSPELVWQSPEWLQADQRASDVSPAMVWIPVITALQVGVDMLGGEAVPARHGHNFGDVVTAGWRAIIGDAGLSDAAVERIAAKIETYAPIQPHEP